MAQASYSSLANSAPNCLSFATSGNVPAEGVAVTGGSNRTRYAGMLRYEGPLGRVANGEHGRKPGDSRRASGRQQPFPSVTSADTRQFVEIIPPSGASFEHVRMLRLDLRQGP